ncbi:hypothetical protein [Streptomyces sp. NRRL F-2799]|uniref:hypothetical protein n=1 Tax=Streptomyces sp. NRRL F-2799 TaxID=1463844 RepID=UPI0004C6AC54|nr:hypothetical protein [Streptomyces sp. NRRL F-2799]
MLKTVVRFYILAVVVLGLVNAAGLLDRNVMFPLCLVVTLPSSVVTAPLLYYLVVPGLAFAGVPSAVAQFLADFGYVALGGLLNVLLLRAIVAVVRKRRRARTGQ